MLFPSFPRRGGAQRRGGCPSLPQRFPNSLKHKFHPFTKKLLVLKPQDSEPLLLQIHRPLRLVVLPQNSEVCRSIKIDYQPAFRTVEIDNVRTYALLASELLSQELSLLKVLPQNRFGRYAPRPQLSTLFLFRFAI